MKMKTSQWFYTLLSGLITLAAFLLMKHRQDSLIHQLPDWFGYLLAAINMAIAARWGNHTHDG